MTWLQNDRLKKLQNDRLKNSPGVLGDLEAVSPPDFHRSYSWPHQLAVSQARCVSSRRGVNCDIGEVGRFQSSSKPLLETAYAQELKWRALPATGFLPNFIMNHVVLTLATRWRCQHPTIIARAVDDVTACGAF